MRKDIKIGLLPLYIKLYDDIWPEVRSRMDAFVDEIAGIFSSKGITVLKGTVCRTEKEFEAVIKGFEDDKADAVVTLHLAYSPSLESSRVLAKTAIPVIALDTTPAYDYSPGQDPAELMYNHGIHGVQDMCNLLLRNGKPFLIEAGHYMNSDVIDRTVSAIKAAKLASEMRRAKVGRVGISFEGMGDFDVPEAELKETIGIDVITFDPAESTLLRKDIHEADIEEEMRLDRERFETVGLSEKTHRVAVEAGLILRTWAKKHALTAYSVNFMAIDSKSGFRCMPFLEAGKAMAEGTGYAGEGDALTAALTGALMSVYDKVSFTEMFCPDWKNDTIFLSHMGEMNVALSAEKPVLKEIDFLFSDAENTVVARGRFMEGRVTYVNLSPSYGGGYTLILAGGRMLGVDGEDKMHDSVHGWFAPDMPVAPFLEQYSLLGGTHHSALVYGDVKKELAKFGSLMKWHIAELC